MTGNDQRRDREERHEPHAPYEWHEPMQDEQEHTHTHAGNRTVNHGPDELGPEETAPDGRTEDGRTQDGRNSAGPDSGGTSPAGAGSDTRRSETTAPLSLVGLGLGGGTGDGTGAGHDPGPEGLDPDEAALRALLHGAVQEVRPRDGALEHLRRAVPARRARKRQALVGAAAAALFLGTAVPALLHVSDVTGSAADPSIAGSSSQAHGGTGQGKNPDGGSGPAGTTGGQSKGNGSGSTGDQGKSSGPGAGTDGASASPSAGADVPLCKAAQLGSATSTVASPDSAGVVYGTFRVVNVSGEACLADAGDSLTTTAQGAADPAKISVARHVSGDAATDLPDTHATKVLMQAGDAYQVRFAWVPSQTCPTSGGDNGGTETGGASPDPSPSTDAGTGTADTSGGTGAAAPQLFAADGTADGSVVVSYTPAAGSPAVSATVTGACAGTVYRTWPVIDTQS